MQSHCVTTDLIQESRALFVFHYGSVKYERIQLGFFCLFGGFRPTRGLFTHMETSPANFDLCSALMAIEQ